MTTTLERPAPASTFIYGHGGRCESAPGRYSTYQPSKALPDSGGLRRYIDRGRNPGKYRTLKSSGLYAVVLDDGMIGVQYHNTVIVAWLSDTLIALDTGGWYTMSTSRHMGTYSPIQVMTTGVGRRWAIGRPKLDLAVISVGHAQNREINDACFGETDHALVWQDWGPYQYPISPNVWTPVHPFWDCMMIDVSTGEPVGTLEKWIRPAATPRPRRSYDHASWYGPTTQMQMGPRVTQAEAEAARAKWRRQ